MFSSNISEYMKNQIRDLAGVNVCHNPGTYLGLPSVVGKSKTKTFGSLKDRIWYKVHNWKNSYLTLAGKEIMLKAIIQVIPSYTMNVFKLPKKIVP